MMAAVHATPPDPIVAANDAVTALVVDDDRHVRSYLWRLLRGLQVTTLAEAGNVAEGVIHYRRFRPTVILLDVDLPGVAAAESMQLLRAVDPNVAVIAVTARIEVGFWESLGRLGVLACVPIHVVREEVAQKISTALDLLVTQRARTAPDSIESRMHPGRRATGVISPDRAGRL